LPISSCDFEPVYTNIKPSQTTSILVDFLDKYLDHVNLTKAELKTIFELLLTNNIFKFKEAVSKKHSKDRATDGLQMLIYICTF
jgi:hypothetical protein